MGLLDSLNAATGATGGAALPTADARASLTQAVLGMLVHGNEPGGLGGSGGIGGLAGLLERFHGAGLGAQASSWVGTGANLPISADQIKAALAGGPLHTLAEHVGIDPDQAAAYLSQYLPQIVDHLTPGGQVPQTVTHPGGLGGLFDSLGHLFEPR